MIYLVEDDISIRDLMSYTLKIAGYECEGFSESESFFAAMERKLPELILLDIMLPGTDGITILKTIRSSEEYSDIPVIMTTAKGSEFDKVIALDLGADDYLAKPFGMMEMVSRIKAVLRRTGKTSAVHTDATSDIIYSNGPISMNETRHTVTSSGEEIVLTFKEYELLKLLMQNIGVVFSRDTLLQRIWGIDFMGESRTVDVHVGTLRNKLGVNGDHIVTVRGVGYKIESIE